MSAGGKDVGTTQRALQAVSPATWKGCGTGIALTGVLYGVTKAAPPQGEYLEYGIEAAIAITVVYAVVGMFRKGA